MEEMERAKSQSFATRLRVDAVQKLMVIEQHCPSSVALVLLFIAAAALFVVTLGFWKKNVRGIRPALAAAGIAVIFFTSIGFFALPGGLGSRLQPEDGRFTMPGHSNNFASKTGQPRASTQERC